LFLDVDGTLVELTETPRGGDADEELKSLLAAARARLGGALALISGRSIRHLDALFAPLKLAAAGLHGLERRDAAGLLHGGDGDSDGDGGGAIDHALDGAREALRAFVGGHPAAVVEDKGRTLAIHYRAQPRLEAPLRALTAALAAASAGRYQVQEGILVFELKPGGCSKGTAIAAFLGEPPFAARTPVFIGDDLTDNDGFAAVEAHGGISVAVDDPVAVRALLRAIAALPARPA
jgi:trehalose 6-phosphate phosphatase